jgi:hypothetical protein
MREVLSQFSDFYLRDWRSRSIHFVFIFFASVVYAASMDIIFHRPSDEVAYGCVALVGFLMVALPILTIARQLRNKASQIGTPVYQAVRDVHSKLTEAAGTNGVECPALETVNLDLTQGNAQHAVEALGKVLTETAKRLERFKEYEAKWRPMFLSIIKEVEDTYKDPQTAYRILLGLADKNDWPAWAVRCLPSLYDKVETQKDGRIVAHVSQYVLGGLAPSYDYDVAEKLCKGEILKVAMPEETAKRAMDIAEELTNSLRHNPNESDRAFIGTIITIWSRDEKISSDAHDPEASQKLKVEREKVLAEENVMSAHGL